MSEVSTTLSAQQAVHRPLSALDILSASRMNEYAYESPEAQRSSVVPGWEWDGCVEMKESGLSLSRWRSSEGMLYLAVRGTQSFGDVAQSLMVFLGQNPVRRQQAFMDYIETYCANELQEDRLFVGGHSLGGLVASAAAARWNLPGLVQNSPGWMANPPPPDKLARLLEIRTSRDTVGEWGSAYPRTLVVTAPHLPTLEVSALHSIRTQNQLIEQSWFSCLSVEDPELVAFSAPTDSIRPGVLGIPSRIQRAWRLLRRAHLPLLQDPVQEESNNGVEPLSTVMKSRVSPLAFKEAQHEKEVASLPSQRSSKPSC